MNDEIKEILQRIKKHYVLNEAQDNLLLDCITNLQQEIKEANDSITWWTNRFKVVERDNRELKEEIERQSKAQVILDDMLADYGYRIDKAVEYINIFKNDIRGIDEIVLLNILQNGSEE